MKITIVQSYIYWRDKRKNMEHLEAKVNGKETDIVLFPEMFNTGFNIDPTGLAEDWRESETLKWMERLSRENGFVVGGSIIWQEGEEFYNRFFLVSGRHKAWYDKRHSFSMAGEDRYFSRGKYRVLVKLGQWVIKPLVCYDLRFPVWARNDQGYDLLIYVANWPKSRIEQWRSLLIGRAIENQSYVIGVNRVGEDGNGFYYSGMSMVVGPKGNIIYQAPEDEEDVVTVELDLGQLHEMREKFPVLRDMDGFEIEESLEMSFVFD